MKFKLLLWMIIPLLIFSCDKKKNKQISSIVTYDISKAFMGKATDLNLNEVGDTIIYIIFKEETGISIDLLSTIHLHKDTIYIYSPRIKKLFAYDFRGNFLFNIGKIGKGPGEYLNLIDFTIDHKENRLFAYDYLGKKVLCFNTNGQFVNDFYYDQISMKMMYLDNNIFFFNPRPTQCFSNNYIVTKVNLKGKVVRRFRQINGESVRNNNVLFNTIYQRGDTICFWDCYSDTVFQIYNDNISPRFSFNLGKNKLPISLMKSKTNYSLSFKKYDNVSLFFEMDNLIFIHGNSLDKVKAIVFNKINMTAINCMTENGYSSIDKPSTKILYPFFPTHLSNESMIQLIDVEKFIKWNKKNESFQIEEDQICNANSIIAILK